MIHCINLLFFFFFYSKRHRKLLSFLDIKTNLFAFTLLKYLFTLPETISIIFSSYQTSNSNISLIDCRLFFFKLA